MTDLFPTAERLTRPVAYSMLPCTVLDAKDGKWQDRKRLWKAMGIRSEVGREGNLLKMSKVVSLGDDKDTSIFDPVLCELLYRWFAHGQVVDPFAGGSVRGVVASLLGLDYWGCDLRMEQCLSNEEQAHLLCSDHFPRWRCGDSKVEVLEAPAADFVFSCPPYGDLEQYSDDPADLSTMEWPVFLDVYRTIIANTLARLKPNRFACFVVGDFRDGDGNYRNFVSETIKAFQDEGVMLFNEIILATVVGSTSMRVTKQFTHSRKMGKTHQNVLVFCKGDPELAAEALCAAVG